MNTTVALYARVSSDRQDVDLSVAAQLRALRDYAKKNEHSVAQEYIDEAESGRIADRPQFRKMLDEASAPDAPFKEIQISPGKAPIVYTIPMPEESPIGASDATKLALNERVMNTICVSGAEGSRTPDLRIANAALSQLSYSPMNRSFNCSAHGPRCSCAPAFAGVTIRRGGLTGRSHGVVAQVRSR